VRGLPNLNQEEERIAISGLFAKGGFKSEIPGSRMKESHRVI